MSEGSKAGVLSCKMYSVDKLVPYARNPRKNDAAVDRMVAAIKEFGFRIPIVAKSDGTVVDGHLRLKAAKKLGMQKVPVALADELTDTQIKAFRLLANQSANWAEWDTDLLKIEIDELKTLEFDIDQIGFDSDFLEGLLEPVGDLAGESGNGKRNTGVLVEQFGVAPFSVLSARDGWWQERKRAWIDLGITSGDGRGASLLKFSDTAIKAIHGGI